MNRPFQFDRFVAGLLLRGVSGMAAIAAATTGAKVGSGICLAAAVWADVALGWMARRKSWPRTPSVVEVEALVDFLCFVWAPVQFVLAETTRLAALAGAGVFVAAGIFRLARFKVEGLVAGRYRGLPVTYNGYIFPLAGIVNHYVPGHTTVLFLLVLLVVSALMASGKLMVPEG